jgi:lipid A 4'-phosphatase
MKRIAGGRSGEGLRQRSSDQRMNRLNGLLFTLCALAALIVVYPRALDLTVAHFLFSAPTGKFLGSERTASLLQSILAFLTVTFVTVCLAVLAIDCMGRLRQTKLRSPVASRSVIYLLLALALGPGLVINGIFKQAWGRARPRDVVEFGEKRHFSGAFVLSDQCTANCSFVSGESSLGFYGLTFMFVARRRRKTILAASLLGGSSIGLVRMSVGAHFLSDILFSGVFTFVVSYLVYLCMFHEERREKKPTVVLDPEKAGRKLA